MKKQIKREFKVFNSENELIYVFDNVNSLVKTLPLRKDEVYTFKNTDRFVKGFRIEYSKEVFEVNFRLIPKSRRIKIQNLEDEVWKDIKGYPGNFCSNKGRFKFVDLEGNEKFLVCILVPNKTKRIYRDVSLLDQESLKPSARYRTSRVLAKTFLNPSLSLSYKLDKTYVVDHIEDKFNEDGSLYEGIENLQVLTQHENLKKAVYIEGKVFNNPLKSCVAYNVKTKETRHYISTTELCLDIFNSNNPGYFNRYRKLKSTTKTGWKCGFSLEEILSE